MKQLKYSKLKLKIDESTTTYTYKVNEDTSYDIIVKNYLPVSEKIKLIATVIGEEQDGDRLYIDRGKLIVLFYLNVIFAYTNLSFNITDITEYPKLYDELQCSGIMEGVLDILAENDELVFLLDMLNSTIDGVYRYKNSPIKLVESLQESFTNLSLESEEINKNLSNPENLALLKNIMNKM